MQVDHDAFDAYGGGGDNKALQKRLFIWDVSLVIAGLARQWLQSVTKAASLANNKCL
jgi:hypothetical protein